MTIHGDWPSCMTKWFVILRYTKKFPTSWVVTLITDAIILKNRISQKRDMNSPISKKKQFLNCALKDYIFYGYQF